jgi:hypothetical protein
VRQHVAVDVDVAGQTIDGIRAAGVDGRQEIGEARLIPGDEHLPQLRLGGEVVVQLAIRMDDGTEFVAARKTSPRASNYAKEQEPSRELRHV